MDELEELALADVGCANDRESLLPLVEGVEGQQKSTKECQEDADVELRVGVAVVGGIHRHCVFIGVLVFNQTEELGAKLLEVVPDPSREVLVVAVIVVDVEVGICEGHWAVGCSG